MTWIHINIRAHVMALSFHMHVIIPIRHYSKAAAANSPIVHLDGAVAHYQASTIWHCPRAVCFYVKYKNKKTKLVLFNKNAAPVYTSEAKDTD